MLKQMTCVAITIVSLALPLTSTARINPQVGPNVVDPRTKNQAKQVKETQLLVKPIQNNTNVRRK